MTHLPNPNQKTCIVCDEWLRPGEKYFCKVHQAERDKAAALKRNSLAIGRANGRVR